MEITTKHQLLEAIRNQSLKLLKENQALVANDETSTIEDKISDVDAGLIQVNEKRLEKLDRDEETALEKEEYVTLQEIKKEKVQTLEKLIASYKVKIQYLEKLKTEISQDLAHIGVKGDEVFKNKPIIEFNNEDFLKGQKIRVNTISSSTKLEKISDNNNYNVLETNATGLKPGDLLALPNIKVGSPALVTIYRKIGERFVDIGKTTLKNITQILKNPS